MSYAKLRGKICEVCGTQKNFSAAVGLNPATVSGKLAGKIDWSRKDIEKACQVLGIPMAEMHVYFFA